MPEPFKISRYGLLAALCGGILCGVLLGLYLTVGQNLPQIEALENFEPGAVTRILSRDGRVLAELYVERRLPLSLDQIPPPLRQAVIAIEDRRFHHHPGLDLIRNIGALVRDIKAWKLVQGGSTITQQLAKNLFLTSEKTLRRKLKEALLALQIERRYTKEEILKLYLNQVYFGAGAYGVEAASQIYFSKPVSDLTMAECALLAGLLQYPEGYKPFKYPERALARRRTVLQAMVREGFISSVEAAAAADAPLRLSAPENTRIKPAPYFVQYVENRLLELFGENAVYKGGLTVETTLDFEIQQTARTVLSDTLSEIQSGNDGSTPSETGKMVPLQGSLVAIEPGTGAILAWIGGRNYTEGDPDRVQQTGYFPAETFYPFIYADALERGFTQADPILDAPLREDSDPIPPGTISEAPTREYEGEITLRRALAVDSEPAALRLLGRIGLDHFFAYARKTGLTSPLPRDLSLARGRIRMPLLEIATVYNVLAGGGLYVQPHGLKLVKDRSGMVIYRANPARRAGLTPETAYIITDMLKENGRNQTRISKSSGPNVVGKGSRGSGDNGALFVGYSTEITSGVWIGADPPARPIASLNLREITYAFWSGFMKRVSARPAQDFSRPMGVVMSPMNRYNGRSASPSAPGTVMAAFIKGSEPQN